MSNREEDFTTQYMFLSRCQMDCNTYIHDKGFKWGARGFFGGSTVAEHIKEMRSLYDVLPVKPEWLPLSKIDEYEKEMLEIEEYNKNNAESLFDILSTIMGQ